MGSFAECLASALGVALCLLAVALCRTPGWPRLLPPGQVPLDDVVVSPLLSFSGVTVIWMRPESKDFYHKLLLITVGIAFQLATAVHLRKFVLFFR